MAIHQQIHKKLIYFVPGKSIIFFVAILLVSDELLDTVASNTKFAQIRPMLGQ
jgi:hypothetical protein